MKDLLLRELGSLADSRCGVGGLRPLKGEATAVRLALLFRLAVSSDFSVIFLLGVDGRICIYIMRTSSAAAGFSGGWGRGGREKS